MAAALAGRADKRALARRYLAFEPDSALKPGTGNILTSYDIPIVIMLLGEPGLTLDYLERLAPRDGGLAEWAIGVPIMDPIRCDPRFVAMVESLKTRDARAGKVCGKKD